MRNFAILFISILLSALLGSCIYDNGGYPDKVKLSNKLTEKTVSGNSRIWVNTITISDFSNENNAYTEDINSINYKDTFMLSLQWLTVKSLEGDNKVTFIANREPTPDESRTMRVGWMYGDLGITVYVKYQ